MKNDQQDVPSVSNPALLLKGFAGFGVKGYRSFGELGEIQRVGPMSRVHLLVGKNNSGKSNVIRFVETVLSQFRSLDNPPLIQEIIPSRFDIHDRWPSGKLFGISLAIRPAELMEVARLQERNLQAVANLLCSPPFYDENAKVIWLDFDLPPFFSGEEEAHLKVSENLVEAVGLTEQRTAIQRALFDLGYSDPPPAKNFRELEKQLRVIIYSINPFQFIPPVRTVEAIRRLGDEPDGNFRYGGGLITKLASLERPPEETYQQDRARFAEFEQFVRTVLEDPGLFVTVPAQGGTILFDNHLGVRSIDRLGTGITEVVILAANAIIYENSLLCIEEPEIHLHPELQRKLLNYLQTSTSNQYLLSTHSSVFLNSESVSVSHISMVDGSSQIKGAVTPSQLSRVVSDLGNRASDLIQANYIIWVEGPTDRLYIRKWLSLYDSRLLENAHYVIMFYGGVLLKHLTAADEPDGLEDLIELFKINRNFSIVIDSDKKAPEAELDPWKNRLLNEIEGSDSHAWVTHGYTIENYLDASLLKAAIVAAYPKKGNKYTVSDNKFQSPLGGEINGKPARFSKMDVAREAVVLIDRLPEDVEQEIKEITKRVRHANGIDELD